MVTGAPMQDPRGRDDGLLVPARNARRERVEVPVTRAELHAWLLDGLARYMIRCGYPRRVEPDGAALHPDVVHWDPRTRTGFAGDVHLDPHPDGVQREVVRAQIERFRAAFAGMDLASTRVACCAVSERVTHAWASELASLAGPMGFRAVPVVEPLPRALRGNVAVCHVVDARVVWAGAP
jgi:hypothetical protein